MNILAYDDDRPGMTRVHVTEQQVQDLCRDYSRDELRDIARMRNTPAGAKTKVGLARALVLDGFSSERDGRKDVEALLASITARDRRVAAQTLRETADELSTWAPFADPPDLWLSTDRWLRARADEIEAIAS